MKIYLQNDVFWDFMAFPVISYLLCIIFLNLATQFSALPLAKKSTSASSTHQTNQSCDNSCSSMNLISSLISMEKLIFYFFFTINFTPPTTQSDNCLLTLVNRGKTLESLFTKEDTQGLQYVCERLWTLQDLGHWITDTKIGKSTCWGSGQQMLSCILLRVYNKFI